MKNFTYESTSSHIQTLICILRLARNAKTIPLTRGKKKPPHPYEFSQQLER